MKRTIKYRVMALVAAVIFPMFVAAHVHAIATHVFDVQNFDVFGSDSIFFDFGDSKAWAPNVVVTPFTLKDGETIRLWLTLSAPVEIAELGVDTILGPGNEAVLGNLFCQPAGSPNCDNLGVVQSGLTWEWDFTGVTGDLVDTSTLTGGTGVPEAFFGNLTNTSFQFDDIHIKWTYSGEDITINTLVPLMAADQINPVPEPSTMLLLGSGLAGLGWFRRRRKKVA